MNSTNKLNKNLVVNLSRSEFNRLALKYNALSNVHTCNIKITRVDFKHTTTKSITLTRSDFSKRKHVVSTPSTKCADTTKLDQTNTLNGYNMRKRKCTSENIAPPAKKSRNEIVRKISTSKMITAEKTDLIEGLVVIAKMRTYAAWPACILSLQKTCVTVHFFGDNTRGNVSYNNVGLMMVNDELLKCNLKKKITGYSKAVREMEISMGISFDLSILNF